MNLISSLHGTRNRLRSERGFTLVELLVVVVILVALAVIAFTVFVGQKSKAQDATTETSVQTLGEFTNDGFVTETLAGAIDGTQGTVTFDGSSMKTGGMKVFASNPPGGSYCVSGASPTGKTYAFTSASMKVYETSDASQCTSAGDVPAIVSGSGGGGGGGGAPARAPGWSVATVLGSSFLTDIQTDGSNLYAAQTNAPGKIHKLDLTIMPSAASTSGSVSPTTWTTGVVSKPTGLAVSGGTFYAASKATNRVVKYTSWGATSGVNFAGNGATSIPGTPAAWTTKYTTTNPLPSSSATSFPTGQLSSPVVVGSYLYFSSTQSGCVYKAKLDGTWADKVWCSRTTGSWSGSGGAEARNYHMTADGSGNVYAVNYGVSSLGFPTQVVKIVPNGTSADTLSSVTLSGISNGTGIATNSDASKIWVTTDGVDGTTGNKLYTLSSPSWGPIGSPTSMAVTGESIPGANSVQGLTYDAGTNALYLTNNDSDILVDLL